MSAYVCHASTIIWFFTPPGHSACAVAFPNIFSIFFFSLSINKKRKKKILAKEWTTKKPNYRIEWSVFETLNRGWFFFFVLFFLKSKKIIFFFDLEIYGYFFYRK